MSLGSISALPDYRFDSRVRRVGLESTTDDSHRRVPAFEFTRYYGYTTSQALKSHRNSESNLHRISLKTGFAETAVVRNDSPVPSQIVSESAVHPTLHQNHLRTKDFTCVCRFDGRGGLPIASALQSTQPTRINIPPCSCRSLQA
jgi:hypothetical protein